MGLIQKWVASQQRKNEQRAIDARNAQRRALCVEYARNKARQGAIIQRLAELNHDADIKGAAARIAFELEGIDRRAPQVDLIRHDPVRAKFESECA